MNPLTFNFITTILICLLLTFGVIFLMYVGSDLISSLGTYHKRRKKYILSIHKINNEEPLIYKTLSAFLNSAMISLPFIAAFYIYIPGVIGQNNFDTIFCLTLILTLSLMLAIRLTSNPTKAILLKKIQQRFNDLGYDWNNNDQVQDFFNDPEVINVVKNHKERVLSFAYAFLIGALLLVYVQILNIIIDIDFSHSNITILSTINSRDMIFYIIIFYLSLLFFNFIGEIILWWMEPIIEE